MRSRSSFCALVLTALLPAALMADYRIEVKGGGVYWSVEKPVLKGPGYTFKTADGTFMLLKKADVLSVRESAAPKKEKEAVDIGKGSPVEAAASSRQVQRAPRPARRPPSDLEKSDAYRPGRGVANPVTPDQYQVGRTLAPPASGQVLTGPPPKAENPPR